MVSVLAVLLSLVLLTAGCLTEPEKKAEKKVEKGDQVEVDFVGWIGVKSNGGYDKGKVFDTTKESVAKDNTTFPKDERFEYQEEYKPLKLKVEESSKISYWGPMPGFINALIGMKKGETKTVTLFPEDTVGEWNETYIRTDWYEVVEKVPRIEKIPMDVFMEETGEEPAVSLVFTHPVWTWNATVIEVTGNETEGEVVFVNLPQEDDWNKWWVQGEPIIRKEVPWNSTVINITDEYIYVRNNAEIGMEVKGPPASIKKVYSIDEENNTIAIDTNNKLAGEVLIFRITLLSIEEELKIPASFVQSLLLSPKT